MQENNIVIKLSDKIAQNIAKNIRVQHINIEIKIFADRNTIDLSFPHLCKRFINDLNVFNNMVEKELKIDSDTKYLILHLCSILQRLHIKIVILHIESFNIGDPIFRTLTIYYDINNCPQLNKDKKLKNVLVKDINILKKSFDYFNINSDEAFGEGECFIITSENTYFNFSDLSVKYGTNRLLIFKDINKIAEKIKCDSIIVDIYKIDIQYSTRGYLKI